MKKLLSFTFSLCLALSLTVPALADYVVHAPDGPDYGEPTSVETVYTPGNGEQVNEYVGKDAVLIPPAFGAGGIYPLNAFGAGTFVVPSNAVIGSGTVTCPGQLTAATVSPVSAFTQVTEDLKYDDGSLGVLTIPSLGVSTKIYEGTSTASMARGAAHFEETSIWNGNVALAGHNRGTNEIFGKIHTLNAGDTVTLTTKLGTRTYAVASVEKISETDKSGLSASYENTLTLYTCVMNERPYRWCVTAVETE